MEMPNLPDGVNHRLSEVYYYGRDGRRSVKPPPELYKVDEHGQSFCDLEGKALRLELLKFLKIFTFCLVLKKSTRQL